MAKEWDGTVRSKVSKKHSKSMLAADVTLKDLNLGKLADLGEASAAAMFLPTLQKSGKHVMNKLADGLGDGIVQAVNAEGGIKGMCEARGLDWFSMFVGFGFACMAFMAVGGVLSVRKMLK